MKTITKASILLATGAIFLGSVAPSLAYDGCGWGWNHPARREVLWRDAKLNSEINFDRGHLSGQYGLLKAEDRAIRNQEQFDAAMNGGHLTRGETIQLNREENQVQRQINRDFN